MINEEMHRPTAAFRAQLETEISRALWREQGNSIQIRGRRNRFLFVSSLAASLAIGVVLGAAPAQIQDARQRESLLSAELAAENVSKLRLQMAEEQLRVMNIRSNLGMVASDAIRKAAMELRDMQLKLDSVRLNIAEIELTSASPRDEVSAPLVGKRDFVKERLHLSLALAQQALVDAEATASQVEQRHRVGAVSDFEVQSERFNLAMVRMEMERIAGKLALRETFLSSQSTAADTERKLQILELRLQLTAAEEGLQLAVKNLELAKLRVEKGMTTRTDALHAEIDVLNKQSEIEKIKARLRLLSGGAASG